MYMYLKFSIPIHMPQSINKLDCVYLVRSQGNTLAKKYIKTVVLYLILNIGNKTNQLIVLSQKNENIYFLRIFH